MLGALGVTDVLPRVNSMHEALEVYHSFKDYEAWAAHHGVVAFRLARPVHIDGPRIVEPQWTPEQKMIANRVDEIMENSMTVANPDIMKEVEQSTKLLWEHNKIFCLCRPPGSGKTSLVHGRVAHWLRHSANVLFVLPTAAFESRIREIYRNAININTCHVAFAPDQQHIGTPSLAQYNTACCDEVSQFVAEHFWTGHSLLFSPATSGKWQALATVHGTLLCGGPTQVSNASSTMCCDAKTKDSQ